jgi:hypothetical protein
MEVWNKLAILATLYLRSMCLHAPPPQAAVLRPYDTDCGIAEVGAQPTVGWMHSAVVVHNEHDLQLKDVPKTDSMHAPAALS